MSCYYYGSSLYNPYAPKRAFYSESVPYTKEPYDPSDEDGLAACIPLPTEEFLFTSRICASVKRDNGVYANIYFVIDEVVKVTVGTVSYTQSILDVQFGAVVSIAGFNGSGIGGTFEVKVNTASGVISACANLNYVVGTVAPWYGVITTLGTVLPAPS